MSALVKEKANQAAGIVQELGRYPGDRNGAVYLGEPQTMPVVR